MSSWIALLRGVNVGGARKLPMAELRSMLADLGYGDVRTYVQSGNAVFEASLTDPDGEARRIEAAITSRFGFATPVVLRDRADLARVVIGNPFPEVADPTRLHVAFCVDPPDLAGVADLDPDAFLPERWSMGRREVYLHLPEGIGTAKLGHAFFEKRLAVSCTARNWRTVTTLLDMVS